jgi:hypothetical protein
MTYKPNQRQIYLQKLRRDGVFIEAALVLLRQRCTIVMGGAGASPAIFLTGKTSGQQGICVGQRGHIPHDPVFALTHEGLGHALQYLSAEKLPPTMRLFGFFAHNQPPFLGITFDNLVTIDSLMALLRRYLMVLLPNETEYWIAGEEPGERHFSEDGCVWSRVVPDRRGEVPGQMDAGCLWHGGSFGYGCAITRSNLRSILNHARTMCPTARFRHDAATGASTVDDGLGPWNGIRFVNETTRKVSSAG